MLKLVSILISSFVLFLLVCYWSVSILARERIIENVEDLPQVKVGLLLGTSPKTRQGRRSQFFANRIFAAVELYRAGKIRYILASGDNSNISYNEPIYMQEALIKEGVPADHIILDYAGFSTLDSVIRAERVFGQEQFIIISQRFHNERAVYIAGGNGIDAIAYNAVSVKGYAGFRAVFREIFARVKAIFDVYVFNQQPKFSGPPEVIPWRRR